MHSLLVAILNFFFFMVSKATFISTIYTAKLELDNKKSNNEILGEYEARSFCVCSEICRKNGCFFGYNSKLKKCRTHKKMFTSNMSEETGWKYYSDDSLSSDCKDLPENCATNSGISIDCKDLRNNGHTKSAVYDIYPSGASSRPVKVYCDMETMDGGWTAIQKRVNGSESFDRNWTEYKNGFGTPEQDIWIGNDLIHRLTEKKKSSLLVSITLVNGTRLFELYDQFSVSDEAEKYKIFLAGNATGTLGDSMLNTGLNGKNLSGMYFSTPKTDNDKSGGFCAGSVGARGGWWFNDCHYAFLNGNWASVMWTLPWYPTITSALSIKETMMMIKRH